MKEKLQFVPGEAAKKARELIESEQKQALEANLEKKDVSVLMEHLNRYRIYVQFAKAIGLIKTD